MPSIHMPCAPCCNDGPCCGLEGVNLVATITMKTGDCVGMPDTVNVPWIGIGSFGELVWDSGAMGMDCHPEVCLLRLECNNPTYGEGFVMPNQASCHDYGDLVSVSCSPVEIVFDLTYTYVGGPGLFCQGTCRVTFTL